MAMQRQFEVAVGGWGVGNIFPEPRPEYHSEGADRENTNNITGFKNSRVDELCAKYDVTFDAKERVKILQELDNVLTSEYHYVLRWYDPAQRIAYINKYGMPAGTFSRVGDYAGSFFFGISRLWWVDPEKTRKLEQAMSDPSIKLDVPPVEDHYWEQSRN
jgi:ABC-type oligopeptide transport system substrate-binding subunit